MAEHAGDFESSIPLGGAGPSAAEAGEPQVLFGSYRSPDSLPRPQHEYGNVLICVSASSTGFGVLARQVGQSLHLPFDGVRCFPFYTYNEDGSIRRENITDWALSRFSQHYNDPVISKWSIFDYVYGVLHHPDYPTTFADGRAEMPRIPFAPSFRAFQQAGQKLIELHLHADKLEPWELEVVQTAQTRASGVGSTVRLNAENISLTVSSSLSLTGVPPDALQYRLGGRPAIEWLLNRELAEHHRERDDPEQIARTVGQWVRMSLDTVNLLKSLPALTPKTGSNDR